MAEGTSNPETVMAADAASQARTVINVRGMRGVGCVASLERALSKIDGVNKAKANLAIHSAEIWHAPGLESEKLLAAAVAVGFVAEVAHRNSNHIPFDGYVEEVGEWFRRAVAGGAVLVFAMICQLIAWTGFASGVFTPAVLFCGAVVYIYVGWPICRNAIVRLRYLSASSDFLIALGVTTLFGYGLLELATGRMLDRFFLEGIAILTVVAFGRMIETRSRGRASEPIRRLMMLAPDMAAVVDNAELQMTRRADIETGQLVRVSPGERVPLDGEVLAGKSVVDESWLTGHPFDIEKQAGDAVLAGSMNGMDELTVRVTKSVEKTTLARVVDLVRQVDFQKSRWERSTELIATWLVPFVLLVAAIMFCVWTLMLDDIDRGVRASVAVLIVCCPSAFGLATPLTNMMARQRGVMHGILIKSARALEIAGQLSSLLIGKAGSVSTGKPSVVRLMSIEPGVPTGDWLRLAAAAELSSSHPVARAIVARSQKEGLRAAAANEAQSIPGEGVVAVCDGQQVLVGNQKLLRRFSVEPFGAPSPSMSDPQSSVAVAVGGRHVGNIFVDSRIDPITRDVVKRLRKLNVATTMVSDQQNADGQPTTSASDTNAGNPQTSPQDKLKLVERLQKLEHVVGFIGDGAEDAPALAAADLGIVIGKRADFGFDKADVDKADVVIVNNDFQNLVRTVQLARLTRRVIKRNLWWAFGYHLLLIPLAAGVFYPLYNYVGIVWLFGDVMLAPWVAACVMTLSNVSVVSSSLSLNNYGLE